MPFASRDVVHMNSKACNQNYQKLLEELLRLATLTCLHGVKDWTTCCVLHNILVATGVLWTTHYVIQVFRTCRTNLAFNISLLVAWSLIAKINVPFGLLTSLEISFGHKRFYDLLFIARSTPTFFALLNDYDFASLRFIISEKITWDGGLSMFFVRETLIFKLISHCQCFTRKPLIIPLFTSSEACAVVIHRVSLTVFNGPIHICSFSEYTNISFLCFKNSISRGRNTSCWHSHYFSFSNNCIRLRLRENKSLHLFFLSRDIGAPEIRR